MNSTNEQPYLFLGKRGLKLKKRKEKKEKKSELKKGRSKIKVMSVHWVVVETSIKKTLSDEDIMPLRGRFDRVYFRKRRTGVLWL